MAGEFGAMTDHFKILAMVQGTGTLADCLKLVESSKVPVPKNRGDAKDEDGDIVASTYFGNAGGTLFQASCKYVVYAGTLELDTLFLGEVETGIVIESIEGGTENGDWPMISVSGMLGTEALQVPDGKTARAYLPADIDIVGAKRAQAMLFTTGAGCRLNACAIKAAASIPQTEDGVGEPAAWGVEFEPAEITATFVRVTTAPSWTVTSPAVEKQSPSLVQPKAGYHTATGISEVPITREAA